MKLSIIILNYNVRYFLELCLNSVVEATKNIEAEIIVVDNHSTDASCAMVKSVFPQVILIENQDNYGFSKGNNIGVAKAKGEYICILNPDTVVAEDTFVKLLQFAESKENLGAIGCKLVNGSGEFLPESKRNIPYVKVALKKILGNSEDYYADHLKPSDIGKVEILVGAFMFMKQEVYNEVGGFDEDYFMYGEDIDLSYSLINAGYTNYYNGEISVIHYKGESSLRDKNYAKRFFQAMQIFYKKHFKRNFIFDFVVWIGIKLAYTFNRIPRKKRKQKELKNYIFISDEMKDNLKEALVKPVVLSSKFENLQKGDEVIFDANSVAYKDVIAYMQSQPSEARLTYKILPKGASFIIGSENGMTCGEIIELT
ncbi:glycosyltransferase family 2 protein [Gaetbulibacter saemankumensis]|uniref:glycosyltransferase family 2 protein n=1 Tax=Gaetbulibacter saemankumensis TaxID=311208 RepID=UPI0003FCA077|nr:glycosyltransferase family 2 protein [Gaetbulibacter saemankumensis]